MIYVYIVLSSKIRGQSRTSDMAQYYNIDNISHNSLENYKINNIMITEPG